MSAPFLFIGLPVFSALIIYLFRRSPRLGIVLAACLCLLLAVCARSLLLDERLNLLGGAIIKSSSVVLGRTFAVEPINRLGLIFIFAQAAGLFLALLLVEPGRFYLSSGMAILGLLAAALFVQPFLFAALFLELAAAVAVFMLAGETPPATRGALRFLVFMTLGLPLILVTGWLLEAGAAGPGDESFIRQAVVLLSVGFAVLLAVLPFHSWLPIVAEHAPPLATAFVLTVMQFASTFLLLTFLNAYEWLGQNPAVYRALTLAGGAMVLAGALFAFGQRNFGRSLGYAIMVDIGAILLAVGLGTHVGVAAALASLALRGLALTLWGVGLTHLRREAGGDDFDSLRGLGRRYPLASACVILGLLSLVGFPLTAGFPARWSLLSLLAQIHPTAAILLWLGMVSISLVCARGLMALLMPVEGQTEALSAAAPAFSLKRLASLSAYSLSLALIIGLGFFPQWLLHPAAQAAAIFLHLGR